MITGTTETTGGSVRGTVENGIHVFRGIPYGESTADTHRFLPPRPRRWPGVLVASRFGARSPQIARWTAEAPLMAMPAARGLFHRAIAQSASSMQRMATLEEAAEARDHLLAAAGLGLRDVAALNGLPVDRLLEAMQCSVRDAGGIYDFRPVVDGSVLPVHPFDPAAPALNADVPMIVGWCETEQRLRFSLDPQAMDQTWESSRRRVAGFVGVSEEQAADMLETYRVGHPDDSPGDVMTQIYGDHRYRRTATKAAELRTEAGHAPTYAYRLSWRSPVAGGLLRSPHTLCLPFVFATTGGAAGLVGEGGEQRRLERQMADAWVAFARTGDPNHSGLAPWMPYSMPGRATMIFDSASRAEHDPGAAERRALDHCPPYLPRETEGGRRS